MAINPNLPPQHARDCAKSLRQSLHHMIEVGDHTQQDRKTNQRYASIILDVHTLINELMKYADSN